MTHNERQSLAPLEAGISRSRIRYPGDDHVSTLLRLATGAGLVLEALPGRGLDLGAATFQGLPLAWTTGEPPRHPLDLPSDRWADRFIGGLIATCGLDNVGPACRDDGRSFPQHGRIGGERAQNVRWGTRRLAGRPVHWITGTVAQPASGLRLARRILADDAVPVVRLSDTVVNTGTDPEPVMIQYHCNFGAPFLAEGGRIKIPGATTKPRDDAANSVVDRWPLVDGPTTGEKERVFRHEQRGPAWGEARLVPPKDGPAASWSLWVRYGRRTLPWLWQWRLLSTAAYVVGLEPANCAVKPRDEARRRGLLPVLAPGERVVFQVKIGVQRRQVGRANGIRVSVVENA